MISYDHIMTDYSLPELDRLSKRAARKSAQREALYQKALIHIACDVIRRDEFIAELGAFGDTFNAKLGALRWSTVIVGNIMLVETLFGLESEGARADLDAVLARFGQPTIDAVLNPGPRRVPPADNS